MKGRKMTTKKKPVKKAAVKKTAVKKVAKKACCKKCCAKYNIHSIYDYKKKSEIRKRIESKNKYI